MKLSPLRVALVALNIGLTAGLIVQIASGTRIRQLTTGRQVDIVVPHYELNPPAVPSLERIEHGAVFYQARAFYVAPPAQAVKTPPNYRLVGTMTIPQQGSVATLLSNATSVRTKVRRGDELEGWTVSDVTSQRVMLELGGTTAEITSQSSGAHLLQVSAATTASNPAPILSSSQADGIAVAGAPQATHIVTLGSSNSSVSARPALTNSADASSSAPNSQPSLRHYYPPPSPR